MKIRHLIHVAFFSIVVASCQIIEKDAAFPQKDNANKIRKEVILTAQSEDPDFLTRTETEVEVSGSGTKSFPMYWLPGDKMMVYSAGEASEFTSINTTRTRVAKFKGVISVISGADDGTEKDYVWAIYPSSAAVGYSEPNGNSATAVLTADFPVIQASKAGSYADDIAMTIGRSESLGVYFKSVYSCLYFTFARNDIASITLRGRNNETLAGRVNVTLVNNEPVATPVTGYESKKVTMNAPDGGAFVPGQEYYMVFLPQTFAQGISLTLRRTDGQEGTFELRNQNLKLGRNVFTSLATPDSRIESQANINNGTSTGWHDPVFLETNEIWYKSVDNVEIPYAQGQDATVNQLVANIPPSADNDNWGIMRFAAPVTEIDAQAFYGQDMLTSITLPNSVQTIKAEAFSGCELLSEVNLGTGVKEILHSAFSSCGSLTDIDFLPEGLERLGVNAFSHCGSIASVAIPSTVEVLGSDRNLGPEYNPFGYCQNLSSFSGKFATSDGLALVQTYNNTTYLVSFAPKRVNDQSYTVPDDVDVILESVFAYAPINNVVLPDDLREIRSSAFYNCTGLTSITIPSGVRCIDKRAFQDCQNLAWVRLECEVVPQTNYSGGTDYGFDAFAFSFCPIYVPANLLNAYKTTSPWSDYEGRYMVADREIRFTTNDPGAVNELLAGYKTAGEIADYYVDGVPEDGVATVIQDSYQGSVYFGDDLTEIPDNFFTDMSSILTVEIMSEKVIRVGSQAFSGTSISEIALPESVTEIGDGAFSFTNLSDVIIPEGVTTLGNSAFGDCASLVNVTLPTSYNPQSAIDTYPFEGSRLISSFSGNSQAISSDGRCLVDQEGRLFAFAPDGLAGGYYTIPDGVVTIGLMNRAGFKTVYFPNSVKVIDQGAFYGCSQLENVRIGSSVEDIRDAAFQNCSSLRSVTIPPSVRLIRNYAFEGCASLNTVIMVNCVTPPQLYANNQTFGDTNDTFKIVIPGAGYQAYCAATGWTDLQSHFDLVQTNREIWFTTVSGDEIDMRGVTGEDPRPFYFANGGFWVAVFDDPVTSIPDQAFWKDTDLKTMNLPGNVQSIGYHAFAECTQLESVKLLNPDALTTIGSYAFFTSQKLRVVGGNVEPINGEYITDLPAVTSLGAGAFYQDSKITNLRLPVLETLNGSIICFAGIKSLDIPNVKTLASGAIYGSSSLKVLNLPSVETMAQRCLGQCRYLEEIHIGPNVGSMEACLFEQDGYINYPLTTSEHRQQLKIYMEATTPPAVSSETFKLMNDADHGGPVQVQKIYAVYVPAASEAAYEAAWADALSIALPDGMTVAQVVQPMP